MWDDMRFGFSHLTTFSKLALVTDIDWIRKSAKLFGGLKHDRRIIEMRGGFYDGFGEFFWIIRLENAGAHKHSFRA